MASPQLRKVPAPGMEESPKYRGGPRFAVIRLADNTSARVNPDYVSLIMAEGDLTKIHVVNTDVVLYSKLRVGDIVEALRDAL